MPTFRAILTGLLPGALLTACVFVTPDVTSIPITPSSQEAPVGAKAIGVALGLGEEMRLGAMLANANVPQYTWVSDRPTVVAVERSTGVVRALARGQAKVTATPKGSTSGPVRFDVGVVATRLVTSITLAPPSPVMVVGERLRLSARVESADGQVNDNVEWSSTDNTMATVNATTGEVSALRPGKVTILAAYRPEARYKGMVELTIVSDKASLPASHSPSPIIFRPSPASSLAPPPVSSNSPNVTSASLAPSTRPSVAPSPLPTSGTLVGTFDAGSNARDLTFDQDGNAWIVNNSDNGTVTKLSSTGERLGTYFIGRWPQSIVVDRQGKTWVTRDSNNNKAESLVKLDASGNVVGTYHPGGGATHLALDANDNLWVSSWRPVPTGEYTYYHGYSLIKVSSAGKVLATYLDGRTGLGPVAIDATGNVWVIAYDLTDTNQRRGTWRITKLSSAGQVLGSFADSTSEYNDLAIDASGQVWAVSGTSLVKLASNGDVLGTFSGGGQRLAVVRQSQVVVCGWGSTTRTVGNDGTTVQRFTTSFNYGLAVDPFGYAWGTNDYTGKVTKLVP